MKDILAQIIKSLFKYIFNPTVWSRVYSDASGAAAPPSNHQYAHQTPLALPNQPNTLEVELSNNKLKLTFGNSSGIDALTSRIEAISLDDRLSATSSISSIEYPNRTTETETDSSAPNAKRNDFKRLQLETDSSGMTSDEGQVSTEHGRILKKRRSEDSEEKGSTDHEGDDETSFEPIKLECNTQITSKCELIEISSDTCNSSLTSTDDYTEDSSLAVFTPSSSSSSGSKSTSLSSDIEIISDSPFEK